LLVCLYFLCLFVCIFFVCLFVCLRSKHTFGTHSGEPNMTAVPLTVYLSTLS
jgi:hypothetical protein